MAESFLFSLSTNLLIKLSSLASKEHSSSSGTLEPDLRKLEATLSTIKAVLLDAEEQQTHNHELRFWLWKLKYVLYDAEDVLDEFEYEASRRQVEKPKVSSFFSSFQSKLSPKIKEIRKRLDEIEASVSKFNLNERTDVRRVFSRNSFDNANDVLGREGDKENMVNLLMQPCDPVESFSVIPVVGIRGIGKSTLAKMVYNDGRVDKHFELRMWVCVSDDFDVSKLMKEVSTSANGKKFFLVLDDVRSESHVNWNDLRELLLDCASGSKIMVTTCSNQVASTMGSVPAYVLKGLSHEDSMSLFVKWAFREGVEKNYPNLVKIGDEIVRNCGGIPLVVRTLGSVLYQNTYKHDWLLIKDSDRLRLLEQGKGDILPSLKLCYDHLPCHLQRCFAYCSLFPKGYRFDSNYQVHYWMALGYLASPNENEELEDVGLRYLKELFSRCFFQDIEDNGYCLTFKMHDLMHDLAISVTSRECSRDNPAPKHIAQIVRHFSFIDTQHSEKVAELLKSLRATRTTLFPSLQSKNVTQSFVGSESYSELNPTEPQVKFPSEEVRMKLSVAGWGQQEVRTASLMLICCYGNSNLIEDQSCSSIQQASCSFTPEVSPFSCSGRESFSGLNQSKQQRDQVHSDDFRIKLTNLKRQEQNRNALKDKLVIIRVAKNCSNL
ncbi:putative disease resistance protein RGA3 [Pistacia vera]|uniref:putative disease resistance protein RGA3 n=1 Tax=Pistacia vera TaxID=55513 RepID=UPI001263217A|nr:putative disease resistance protein RGA3 [Pistacia vera]